MVEINPRLLALQNLVLERLEKKEMKFRKDWIKNNECECVKSLKPDRHLMCKHITKAIKKEFKEEYDKLRQYLKITFKNCDDYIKEIVKEEFA